MSKTYLWEKQQKLSASHKWEPLGRYLTKDEAYQSRLGHPDAWKRVVRVSV